MIYLPLRRGTPGSKYQVVSKVVRVGTWDLLSYAIPSCSAVEVEEVEVRVGLRSLSMESLARDVCQCPALQMELVSH